MKDFFNALKEKLKKADENFAPKNEKEMREMAFGMISGTASPGKFKGVVGNKGRLLREAVKGVRKLKSKPIKVTEGGKQVGEISRKLLKR